MRLCKRLAAAAIVLAASWIAYSDDREATSKTVFGPSNINLYDGAQALLSGDAEEGVRLTKLGLQSPTTAREQKIAHSNLCAGYMMLGQLETALHHCDWVLERHPNFWRAYNNRALVYLAMGRLDESEQDIRRGQELNPNSEKLKEVKGLYLDESEPVMENITIDDRRNTPSTPVAPESRER